MNCKTCQASTLGFIISIRGGTRLLSVAGLRSRSVYCRPCGLARIAQMDAKDEAQRQANMKAQA